MAYEASEIMTAAALNFGIAKLNKIKSEGDLQTFMVSAKQKITDVNVQFGDAAMKKGFLDLMDPKQPSKLQDMAGGISAALAIRDYMGIGDAKVVSYMTGNKWPSEVEKFRVSAFGFEDYNSSDMIVTQRATKKRFYGISLKKKRQVKAAEPTLINKAFDTLLTGSEFDSLKQKLIKTRIDYFVNLVIEAVDAGIIDSSDIDNFDRLKKTKSKELFEAKGRDKVKFDRAYIDTKGYAAAKVGGYRNSNTKDSKSMRFFVNSKVAEKGNVLWKSFIKIMNDNIDLFSNGLINIILKTKLYEELEAKQLEGFEFDFSLVTAVGDVKQGEAVIGRASVIPLKTTLCGLARIEEKYKNSPYKVVLDKSKMAKSNAAKIFFQLKRGRLILLDLEIRYKGSFTPQPQFQGTLNPMFKQLLKDECGE